MATSRTKLWILLCGAALSIAPPLCHAQENGIQPELKKAPPALSTTLLPKTVNTASPLPAQAKPAAGVSEVPWYWRILGWFAVDVARHNTQKQNDGRPQLRGDFR